VRWRLSDLAARVRDEFGISVSEATLSREFKALGVSKISARPRHHAQDTEAMASFEKTFPPAWKKSGRRSRPERR
jgi:arginine repressor